jgi:hypothetical protein
MKQIFIVFPAVIALLSANLLAQDSGGFSSGASGAGASVDSGNFSTAPSQSGVGIVVGEKLHPKAIRRHLCICLSGGRFGEDRSGLKGMDRLRLHL